MAAKRTGEILSTAQTTVYLEGYLAWSGALTSEGEISGVRVVAKYGCAYFPGRLPLSVPR